MTMVYTGWLVVGAAIALRLRQYVYARSLWSDEAGVAVNIVQRSFRGLMRPLDFYQSAPLGFLWSVKAFTTILGNSEPALRLFSLVSGIGALWAAIVLARKTLKPRAGLIFLALMAVSQPLLYYSNELKPYESDALIALVLVLASLEVRRHPEQLVTVATWFGIAAIATWFSSPSIFVSGAAVLSLIWETFRQRKWRPLVAVSAAGLSVLIIFAVRYFLI